jgi:hypothetical protein
MVTAGVRRPHGRRLMRTGIGVVAVAALAVVAGAARSGSLKSGVSAVGSSTVKATSGGVASTPPPRKAAQPVGANNVGLPDSSDPAVQFIAKTEHVSIEVAQERALVEVKAGNFSEAIHGKLGAKFGGSYITADSSIVVMIVAPDTKDRQLVADMAGVWQIESSVRVSPCNYSSDELNTFETDVTAFLLSQHARNFSLAPSTQLQLLNLTMRTGPAQERLKHALLEKYGDRLVVRLVDVSKDNLR